MARGVVEQVLYRWPSAAKFGRVVPKTKFYEHSSVSAKAREKFVAEVQRITWAYKLADETIHLRGDDAVPEIQVFSIDAKADDVSDAVLAAIDRAVLFPTVFELNRHRGDQEETRMVACYKQLGGPKPKLSPYFSEGWLPASAYRQPLPSALDLSSLFAGLLAPILPIPVRAGERLSETAERVSQARKLERKIATLERRLSIEVQFNRKVELRRELKDRTETLTALTGSESSHALRSSQKDTQWTS
ncbi:DUF4391 domain-containing protein [Acidimicrobium ferrooxidans]|uniref:DUF4391 domain-containing protein n=1 Tax=Acidimicrobium ferrooxidans TaxID=53635 RepID=A0ABS3AP23_9ACTN|nr:DUF4391 domain-containing protein [Acidimicrobium ferrooxidans]